MDKIQQLTFDFNQPTPKLCECGCGRVLPQTPLKHPDRGCGYRRFFKGHSIPKYATLRDKLMSLVQKGATPDECWRWLGTTVSFGYGQFRYKHTKYSAHRASYEVHIGPIPDGKSVLHRCDNPPCPNPLHLFLGTQADNVADKVQKGREARGERHGSRTHPERVPRGERNGMRLHPEKIRRGGKHSMAILTEAQVLRMRELLDAGIARSVVAQEFGVSYSNVCMIDTRKTWVHI